LKERLEEKKRREAIEKQYIRQLDMQHIHDYLQDIEKISRYIDI